MNSLVYLRFIHEVFVDIVVFRNVASFWASHHLLHVELVFCVLLLFQPIQIQAVITS